MTGPKDAKPDFEAVWESVSMRTFKPKDQARYFYELGREAGLDEAEECVENTDIFIAAKDDLLEEMVRLKKGSEG